MDAMVKPYQLLPPAVSTGRYYITELWQNGTPETPYGKTIPLLKLETMQALCRDHIGAPPLPKRVIPVALHDLW